MRIITFSFISTWPLYWTSYCNGVSRTLHNPESVISDIWLQKQGTPSIHPLEGPNWTRVQAGSCRANAQDRNMLRGWEELMKNRAYGHRDSHDYHQEEDPSPVLWDEVRGENSLRIAIMVGNCFA